MKQKLNNEKKTLSSHQSTKQKSNEMNVQECCIKMK